ncbi:unannotated protein [freshwater metagenome]|uniref:Unannotated protein n=1 Tax=freshwater metagenome TaxID=449393 RepID=A0A6J7BM77_9ZZZZ|nr:hypothetical protein [Actinomycetota bacterium]MSW36638.1 hypothetical protein [Actinomycetota bacterium]MSX37783.1 hypothetical protein [Actinomycetota bacterium]
MADPRRSGAYAELLSALVAVRTDPASARFDLEIAEAELAGSIDEATARTLRWWQRESVRGLSDHLATVLPDLLANLAESERDAAASVSASATSWSRAHGTTREPVDGGEPATGSDHVDSGAPQPLLPFTGLTVVADSKQDSSIRVTSATQITDHPATTSTRPDLRPSVSPEDS